MVTISLVVVLLIMVVLYHTAYVKTSHVRLEGSSSLAESVTIVHISDLHGRTHFLNGALHRLVNVHQPDLVMVTGDLTQHSGQLTRVLDELGRIRASDGMYFVPGNYEREEGRVGKMAYSAKAYHAHKQSWKKVMTVLENEGCVLDIGDCRMLIYGFDNSIYGNERWLWNETQQTDLTIFMAHSPNIVSFIRKQGLKADLLLTGHTHGGQVRLFDRTVGAYKHFHVGTKKDQAVGIFGISRGLGTSRIPIRINCFPEITVYHIQ